MKIVDRKTFLEISKPIVFCKYRPQVFESEMCIKGETLKTINGYCDDFFYISLLQIKASNFTELFYATEKALVEKSSLALDFECVQRDGCFDEDQLFAVFEPEDIKGLINILTGCLKCLTG